MFTQRHIRYEKKKKQHAILRFAPRATGSNFGSSNSIGSLKGDPQRDVVRSKQRSVMVWIWF